MSPTRIEAKGGRKMNKSDGCPLPGSKQRATSLYFTASIVTILHRQYSHYTGGEVATGWPSNSPPV
eukprot:843995-Prorocentrum_minimum.AAC.1